MRDTVIKIAICDDEICTTGQLETILDDYAGDLGINVDIDVFYDGRELLRYIETQQPNYDLVFLDIEMQFMNGIEVAQRIRDINQMIMIIFISNYKNYALEAYEVHPFQFIVKPFIPQIVRKYFKQAYDIITAGAFYYDFRLNKDYYRIMVSDIMYFQSQKRLIFIHLRNGSTYKYYDKMNCIQERLAKTKVDFWRIHRSILVNSRYVYRKAYDHIELTDGKILAISEDKRKEFNERYIRAVVKKLQD